MQSLTIVSRMSALAMWQAQSVRAQLQQHYPELNIHIQGIKTQADIWLETPLYKMGGKSLFVKELEYSLLNGDAHIAVHSLKDVPAVLADGLVLGAICERHTPFDAWVCPKGLDITALPSGSLVGTSSLRRIVQLKRIRSDLQYVPLRGNVDTRLKKCLAGEWDAIVLAAAGLERLSLASHITTVFTPGSVLPAVGQGALGIECRAGDVDTQDLLKVLDHAPTRKSVMAERAMNAALGGNCQVAVAGWALIENDALRLIGRVGDPTEGVLLEATRIGPADKPHALGEAVAQDLIQQGALQIIAKMKHE